MKRIEIFPVKIAGTAESRPNISQVVNFNVGSSRQTTLRDTIRFHIIALYMSNIQSVCNPGRPIFAPANILGTQIDMLNIVHGSFGMF